MNSIRGFKLGTFEVKIHTEKDTFVGTLFDSGVESGTVTSKKSHFDCAMKGFAYLKTMNDMPTNYEFLPDTNATCLQ